MRVRNGVERGACTACVSLGESKGFGRVRGCRSREMLGGDEGVRGRRGGAWGGGEDIARSSASGWAAARGAGGGGRGGGEGRVGGDKASKPPRFQPCSREFRGWETGGGRGRRRGRADGGGVGRMTGGGAGAAGGGGEVSVGGVEASKVSGEQASRRGRGGARTCGRRGRVVDVAHAHGRHGREGHGGGHGISHRSAHRGGALRHGIGRGGGGRARRVCRGRVVIRRHHFVIRRNPKRVPWGNADEGGHEGGLAVRCGDRGGGYWRQRLPLSPVGSRRRVREWRQGGRCGTARDRCFIRSDVLENPKRQISGDLLFENATCWLDSHVVYFLGRLVAR